MKIIDMLSHTNLHYLGSSPSASLRQSQGILSLAVQSYTHRCW